jgi:ATP-dependent protease ClpP protease subunit
MWWGKPFDLTLSGVVDQTWVDQLTVALAIRDRPVTVTINSEGGFVDSALSCAHMLRKHRAHTVARVGPAGQCHSAAVFVYAACGERLAHVSSTFLIHDVAAMGDERWTAAAHRRFAASLGSLDHSILRGLALRCGRPVAAIEAVAGEVPFTALTAQTYGLVHCIEW